MPRSHTIFATFALASVAPFWIPFHQWLSLSLSDQRYSHLILIPAISAFFLYLERRKIFSPMAFRPGVGLLFLAASVAIYALLALRVVQPSPNYLLSAVMLSIVLVWVAAFAVCYGVHTFRAALFPLLLLLLIVPVPFAEMDKIIAVLQRGAAEATYLLFKLAGVPMFRNGVTFELPVSGLRSPPNAVPSIPPGLCSLPAFCWVTCS
jgi:exosortase